MAALVGLLLGLQVQAAFVPGECDTDHLEQPQQQVFDYGRDIQKVWDQFCANCHVQHAGNPKAGLDLDAPYSYERIVGVPSAKDSSILLVSPFKPEGSLLFLKLSCEHPGPDPNGKRMPLERPKLAAELRARIFYWILAGARFSPQLFGDEFESGG